MSPQKVQIQCPECSTLVDENVDECPECGYPMIELHIDNDSIEESKEPPLCETISNNENLSVKEVIGIVTFVLIFFAIFLFVKSEFFKSKPSEVQTYPHSQVENDICRYVERVLRTTGGGVTEFISFEDLHRPNPTPDQVQFTFKIKVQIMEGADDKTDILKGTVRYDKLGNADVTVFGLY